MRNTFLLVVTLISLSASSQTNFDCPGFREKLRQLRFTIDSVIVHEDDYYDKIDTLNAELHRHLKLLGEEDRFQLCDVDLPEVYFHYLISTDKRFALGSWDTRMGGTMIDFSNMAFYYTPSGSKSLHLQYGDSEYMDNSKIAFDTLFTIRNNRGEPIYIAYGFGQGSTALPYRVLKAFMVTDGLRQDVAIFPKEIDSSVPDDPNCSGEFFLEYDLHQFKEGDRVREIEFEQNGTVVKIPELKENGRPGRKFVTLIFDGQRYVQK